MSFITSFAAGYRTYIIAAVLIICTLAEKVLGIDIPGVDVGQNWLETILAALGLGTLRAGIAAK